MTSAGRTTLFFLLLLVPVLLVSCITDNVRTDKICSTKAVVTVDFLAPLGLDANALAPQVLCTDPLRNRVFAACANSSAVAVINEGPGAPPSRAAFNIPVGSRMQRWLREEGMRVSSKTGKLYLAGEKRLIIVDPEKRESLFIPLPGNFEAIALDEERERAFLTGRACAGLAVVDVKSKNVSIVPCMEAGEPLPFMAASAPPPIRVPFFDPVKKRVYVVDGLHSAFITVDASDEKASFSARKLPLGSFPRWHTAGVSEKPGMLTAAVESDKRAATHAIAIDTAGSGDVVVDLPEKHTEPAGVAFDEALGELYIPYDNMKCIHVVTFGAEPEVVPIELPSNGVDATEYDPLARTLFASGWNEAVLFIVDMKARKRSFTIPYFPVYPHMNCMAFNRNTRKLYVPTGSTAVNGTFGSGISVFDVENFEYSSIRTGWAPKSLVQIPGTDAFYVFGAQDGFARVKPCGKFDVHALPYPYPHRALVHPNGKDIALAYGPHSSMWPQYYIGGTRNGVFFLDAETGRIKSDRITPRGAHDMIFDKKGRLWALQNTWGTEAPFLVTWDEDASTGSGGWVRVDLPPKIMNECLLRLLALDEKTGTIYACRAGNLNTENGAVYQIDPNTREIISTRDVGTTPTSICVLPEQSKVYVANFDDDTVSVLDFSSSEGKTRTVSVGRKPIALAADRRSNIVYVLNHLGCSLTVIGKEKRTLRLPEDALPNNLIFDPEKRCVYITAHASDEARIYRINPADRESVIETIHTFKHPYGEAVFDQQNAAFSERGQWGDFIFRLTEMAIDTQGRLWVTDYLGGKLWILR